MKPEKPITRKEMYLDVATGGSTELPSPVTREEKYLAKIAGMSVDLPAPVPLKHKFLAKIAGMQIDVPTYTTDLPRIYAYLAKAAGQDVEIPQPVTREEMYWFDYCGGTPTPPEREYTGAVPVTFVADGTPLLDYIISGNTVQSGTPTPDSPVMPQGTGERTGNLFSMKNKTVGSFFDSSGNIISNLNYSITDYIPIEELRNYTISRVSDQNTTACHCYYDENKVFLSSVIGSYGTQLLYSPANTAYIRCSWRSAGVSEIMMNNGSTLMDYEPPGYKIPISSASTTTPVYLGEVETTRRIKKLVLDGTESWTYESQYSRFVLIRADAYYSGAVRTTPCNCSHYQPIYDGRAIDNVPNESIYITSSSGRTAFNIKSTDFTSVTDFKAYLAAQYAAGTPVTVWYVLATEETAVVNEPLMRIGDYADTLSMEQAGVQIPTANGSTTLDVETTVKPSEVYIKYRGEAVGTLSTLSAEVSSPEAVPEEENPEETEETENGSEDISLQHEFEAIE